MATMTLDQLQALVEQQGAQLAALQTAAAAETPLPTEYYTLSQTGETVDAAIRRAMPGGAIDIAIASVGGKGAVRYDTAQSLTDAQQTQARGNIGAAPGGYGLGTTAPQFPDNDANNVTGNGWNLVNSTTANRPNGASWGCIRTDCYYSAAMWQTYYQMGSTCRAVRSLTNGVWSDWAWDNPPMVLGTEYMLSERYTNKPIYTKLVNFGTLPAASNSKSVAFSTENVTALSVDGRMSYNGDEYTLPFTLQNGATISIYAHGKSVTITSGASSLASYSAYVVVRYIKN